MCSDVVNELCLDSKDRRKSEDEAAALRNPGRPDEVLQVYT